MKEYWVEISRRGLPILILGKMTDDDWHHLGCDAMYSVRELLIFWRSMLHISSQ
jgi:hypothetical protein